ncbi:photosystem II reaction center PsbP family protein [Coleofasciculus sp. FACHB-64]|uniref:photosystem II reaction center PsbP n=1 Tax=Cyanophyceae TaxID=3028117 RepID=UPI001687CC4E|nr:MULTISPECIES: photosystem II reaction center PsbP [unclassified Coleofasciculus]MBD1837436.1 photosystem II reaction center PsbP family protein [Coleofasciculus sp. FACHB-501]MBD1892133.1 photosystem II reaction center PsbP family protein [Coleofasciculus sp. FACHB-SPT9]MBD1945527.1 photosystem II reaction center PsbP family protein [Coleofasciculus sp. FACHB-712]MBD2045543.1 photosystem II reaction center PsbP family protein [Coleofasciculus sp. FACHB-64]MBD2540030.1 photosystem II reactio
MLKRIAALLLVVLSVSLQSCTVASATSGLKSYVDSTDGYQFLYPNGWLPVEVKGGADVVFHDIIEPSENVSVVINPVGAEKSLAELGTPTEVGYKLSKSAIAPPGSGREAELVNAEKLESNSKTYYILEYTVKLPNQQRHNLASIAVSRGKLVTFNASTTEKRWEKLKPLLEQVVSSFSVY